METTSLTWSFRESLPLKGCGIDAESVGRFLKWTGGEAWPPDFIFSRREIRRASRLADPALGLAEAFCCKEALLKALGRSYDYRECELLCEPGTGEQPLTIALSVRLRREFGIRKALAWLRRPAGGKRAPGDEVLAAVLIFGDRRPLRKKGGPR